MFFTKIKIFLCILLSLTPLLVCGTITSITWRWCGFQFVDVERTTVAHLYVNTINSNINEYIHCCNSRSTLSGWLFRCQLLDDFLLAVPDNKYRNNREYNSRLWTFLCLLRMRTIPQVDSDQSCIFLTWKNYISWGHLSPCNVCTPAYPYLREIQRKQR